MRRIAFLAIVLGFIFGCQKEASDVDQAFNVRGGSCLLKKGADSFICIDYKADSDSNTGSANCDTEFNRYATSHSLNGKGWISGNNNTCATSTSTTLVGNCLRTDEAIVRYYNLHFSTGSSQTDCTSTQAGTWSAP